MNLFGLAQQPNYAHANPQMNSSQLTALVVRDAKGCERAALESGGCGSSAGQVDVSDVREAMEAPWRKKRPNEEG